MSKLLIVNFLEFILDYKVFHTKEVKNQIRKSDERDHSHNSKGNLLILI